MVNDIDLTFAALAEPTRRRVVELLRERPLRAGEIAARLGMGRPAMSRHLRALLSSGLVDVELSADDGRARRYRLRAERFVALQGWLSELDGYWASQLESFREQAERGREGSGPA
ncbi:MAG: metalloregulator ArsR/SmtB family transcription factor [Actinomycetota bacterium]|nr:metalloregulator ArsR/SmtB family transcription factor [Actinomycetota bacterium]